MKEKFFKAVVKYKKFIVISFLIFALISMLCKRLVSVNYDMNAYLPDNTALTVSIEVMEKEFLMLGLWYLMLLYLKQWN